MMPVQAPAGFCSWGTEKGSWGAPGGKNFVHVRDVPQDVQCDHHGKEWGVLPVGHENLSFLNSSESESVTGFRQYKFLVPGGVMS